VQMTTISQDATHMAEAAVDGALAQIAGDKAVDLVLAPHLVRRATTGPVAHHD